MVPVSVSLKKRRKAQILFLRKENPGLGFGNQTPVGFWVTWSGAWG
jgi:hypothetical protein